MIDIEQKIKQTRVYFYLTIAVIALSVGAVTILVFSYSKLDIYAKNTLHNWEIHNHNVKKVEDQVTEYYHTILKLPLYEGKVQSDLDALFDYESNIIVDVEEMCHKEIFDEDKANAEYVSFCGEFKESLETLKRTKNMLIKSLLKGDTEVTKWVKLVELNYVEIQKFLKRLTTYSKITVEQTIQKTKSETKTLFLSLIALVAVAVLATVLYLIFSTKSMGSIKMLFSEIARKNEELESFNRTLEEKVEERTRQLRELRDYDVSQQEEAREKQEFIIVNDLKEDREWKTQTIYKPSDILSGDGYSIFKNEKGDIIYFLLDGQGHGILPSLTVFAVASTIRQNINVVHNLEGMIKNIIETLKVVLGDYEQLSYSIFWLHNDSQNIDYAIGGMYESFVEYENSRIELKSNNIPAMSFLDDIIVGTVTMDGFRSILTYSDGLVEENDFPSEYSLESLIKDPTLIDGLNKHLEDYCTSDDVTLVYIEKE